MHEREPLAKRVAASEDATEYESFSTYQSSSCQVVVRHLHQLNDIVEKARLHSHITKYPDVGCSHLAWIQEALRIPFVRIVAPDSRESAALSNPSILTPPETHRL